MRGGAGAPPGASRQTWLLAPPQVGAAPPRPPWGGRSAPPPRVTFPSRRKSPKARQGLRPLESPRGTLRSPCGKPHPLDRVSTSNPDRFATLRQVSESVFFLPGAGEDHTLCCQAVARQRGPIRGQELFPDEGDGNREWEQGNKHLFLLYIHFYIYLL